MISEPICGDSRRSGGGLGNYFVIPGVYGRQHFPPCIIPVFFIVFFYPGTVFLYPGKKMRRRTP
jgi:hypothetical protein